MIAYIGWLEASVAATRDTERDFGTQLRATLPRGAAYDCSETVGTCR